MFATILGNLELWLKGGLLVEYYLQVIEWK